MHGLSGTNGSGATNGAGKVVSGNESPDKSDSESAGWFADLARPLLAGADSGFVLKCLTGHDDERTCYRYASGATKAVPAYFFVQILRSEQGQQWLNAAMDGCQARWWREFQSAAVRAAGAEQKLHAIGAIIDS